ncbi:hypothetical protein ANANG_G00184520 [Anguilla anguilla]|uniref:C2H2-type domain-containing protein n=1 Tax=Anguilla anguilla TaxID=7936 RepID=A0A9D3M5W5_ANGAN|nr:hypothetical protein ANANG_G00184520 [Anguilla anguilla]
MCMDPVQKAIMGQTLGLLPAPAKSKHLVSCTLCQLNFNSENQALAHFKGTRHTRKLRVLEAPDARRKAADAVAKETARKDPPESISPNGLLPSTHATDCEAGAVSPPSTGAELSDGSGSAQVETAPDPTPVANPSAPGVTEAEVGEETEEEKAKRLLYCSLCKVAVNSASQLEAHNSGTKHKTMLEARSGAGAIKSFPRQGVKGRLASPTTSATGLQNKTFFCEICDVHVNSETQLKQHISSRRHKDRAAGKPRSPNIAPTARRPGPPALCLSVRSRCRYHGNLRAALSMSLPVTMVCLAKPLPAGLIPGHVTAAGVPPISISSAPLAAALFQTQNLLRPAPGPLRTAHSPVLFSPY